MPEMKTAEKQDKTGENGMRFSPHDSQISDRVEELSLCSSGETFTSFTVNRQKIITLSILIRIKSAAVQSPWKNLDPWL